jgi:hypothetical protein
MLRIPFTREIVGQPCEFSRSKYCASRTSQIAIDDHDIGIGLSKRYGCIDRRSSSYLRKACDDVTKIVCGGLPADENRSEVLKWTIGLSHRRVALGERDKPVDVAAVSIPVTVRGNEFRAAAFQIRNGAG